MYSTERDRETTRLQPTTEKTPTIRDFSTNPTFVCTWTKHRVYFKINLNY